MERVYHFPILLADTESTDGTFTGVIIHWNITVFKENSQVAFLIQGIGKGFFCFSTFWHSLRILFQVCKESIHQWLYHQLTLCQSFFCR